MKSGKSLHDNIAVQFMNSIFTNALPGENEDAHTYTLKERFNQKSAHETLIEDYYDVSNNISNKFSNIFKRKSQKISFFEEKYAIFSVFIRFHYSKGIPYKDGVAGSSPVPHTEKLSGFTRKLK